VHTAGIHRRKNFFLRGNFFVAVLIFSVSIFSLRAASTDFLVDTWNTENGLPSSTVTSIAQTPDGYLWVGTYNGLSRFDGARFVTFDPVSQPELTQARVQGLFQDVTGTLWINTFRGGLTSYRAGKFRNELPDRAAFDVHTTLANSTSNSVTFVTQYGDVFTRRNGEEWKNFTPPAGTQPTFRCADGEGRLWFLTRDSHILQFYNNEFKTLADDGGLSGGTNYTLAADAQGKIWAGAENEIAVWDGKQFSAMTPTNSLSDIQPRALFPLKSGAMWVLDGDRLRKLEGRAWTAEIPAWRGLLGSASGRTMGSHEDADGGLWFNHYGNGLFYIAPDGNFQRLASSPDNLADDRHLPDNRVGAWFQDADGGVWAGVDHGGLVRLHGRRFHNVGPAEGLTARTALTIGQDKDGAMWIGTAGGGLCKYADGKMTSYRVGASSSANFIFSLALRPDGGAWLSANEGEDLFRFLDGHIQRVSWDLHGIKCLLLDSQNRVWVGLKAGSGLARWTDSGRQFSNFGTNAVLPAVRALIEGPDGKIWAGADDGTIYLCAPDQLTAFKPSDALADQPIYSLLAETNGTIWAGTFRGGLLRFKDGKFARITNALPAEIISQILDDGKNLWLGTHQGIFRVAKSALNAVANGHADSLDFTSFGRHDGMASVECSDSYQPACCRAADGKLWFATLGGAVWVQPDEVKKFAKPPIVRIEEMRMDGELADGGAAKIFIPPGRKQLDFRFTALTFDGGDKARFRYRVDGLDNNWVDLDTRRTLSLRNLPPRAYRLRVIACNSEGIWNENAAEWAFTVQPFFYQTLTFKIVAGILIVGGISFGVRRAATRKYRRKLRLLEQQHAVERDRARIAKDIHDDIGAGLTQITLLTELAKREPEQTNANLERITDSARTLTKAMDEIVWAVDPQHDTFNGLMDYISAYAEDYLRVAGVRCRMDLPVNLPATRVDAEVRYNLFLAVKEALNNIVKHARATEVWLRLRVAAESFTFIIEDNGRGLAAEKSGAGAERIFSGAGLENMKKRLATVGGLCEIRSVDGGTNVVMTVFLKNVV
jgi:signal transduction histidine kinase/ligand-binding sensor domain-containing protein